MPVRIEKGQIIKGITTNTEKFFEAGNLDTAIYTQGFYIAYKLDAKHYDFCFVPWKMVPNDELHDLWLNMKNRFDVMSLNPEAHPYMTSQGPLWEEPKVAETEEIIDDNISFEVNERNVLVLGYEYNTGLGLTADGTAWFRNPSTDGISGQFGANDGGSIYHSKPGSRSYNI